MNSKHLQPYLIRHFCTKVILVSALFVALVSSSYAAEWQWAMPTDPNGRMIYLWIPPSCQHVRGVIWGEFNGIEDTAFRSPIIREAAEKSSLAIIYTIPKSFRWFRYDKGAGKNLERMLADLAQLSGYSELKYAPIIPVGHSAASPFPWYMAAWKPQRTLAIISLKGGIFTHPDFDPNASIEGVPTLAITGEYYEWPVPEKSRLVSWQPQRDLALSMRRASDKNLCTLFVDVSRGHFDWTDDLARIVALYITKAAKYRLPADAPLDGPVTLKNIDPKSGWLMEPNAVKIKNPVMAAYGKYPGKPSEAIWFFDGEMAKAVARYGEDQKGKLYQMVGFVQDGNQLPVADIGYTKLKYKPLENDQMSIKLQGCYLDKTPPELLNQPQLQGHSNVPLQFILMTGPAVQTGPDTFRFNYNFHDPVLPRDIQLVVYSPGDEKYRKAYQFGSILMEQNKNGKPQKINFPEIPSQTVGTKSIQLKVTSDCNLPIQYYVKYGPATIEGNKLIFTKIPPRSKFPIKVSVVANQWGSTREPKIQTAKPVEQIFLIEENTKASKHDD